VRTFLGFSFIHGQRPKRRILFFCSCKDLDVKKCHRKTVAELVVREAARRHRRIEIVKWPGSKPIKTRVAATVAPPILKALIRGRKNVPLGSSINLNEFAGLPWGSIVTVRTGERLLPIVSGPAKYQGGWRLPVLRHGDIGGDADPLKRWGGEFRKNKGLESRRG
jgi:hypothetical protein